MTEGSAATAVARFVSWAVTDGRLSAFEDLGGLCAEVVEVNAESAPPEFTPGFYLVWGIGQVETIEKYPSWQIANDQLNLLASSGDTRGEVNAEATWSRC